MCGAAFGSDDPRTVGPRRVVADMLRVPALEIGYPVAKIILMETHDLAGRGPVWVAGWQAKVQCSYL
jgi:hypothetical protein